MTVTSPRLLVVSESRITRRVVEMTFADQGVDLVSASTGPDGLAEWQRHPASIVVADLAMDGLDGLSLARQLQDQGGERAPAVILLVGQSEDVDDAAMAAAGVRAVLRKPLDSLQLVEAVRAATRPGRPQESLSPTMAMVAEPATVPRAAAHEESVSDVAAPVDGAHVPVDLRDEDLERVAVRVAAIWSGDVARVAPAAASEAAERLVRELAPQVIAEVARLVVADVSERLVREEIARMRAGHGGR